MEHSIQFAYLTQREGIRLRKIIKKKQKQTQLEKTQYKPITQSVAFMKSTYLLVSVCLSDHAYLMTSPNSHCYQFVSFRKISKRREKHFTTDRCLYWVLNNLILCLAYKTWDKSGNRRDHIILLSGRQHLLKKVQSTTVVLIGSMDTSYRQPDISVPYSSIMQLKTNLKLTMLEQSPCNFRPLTTIS